MIRVVIGAFIVLYPLLTWFALRQASPRVVAGALVAAFAVMAVVAAARQDALLSIVVRRFGVFALLAAVALASNSPLALKLMPAFAHLWLLFTFASTLVQGPPFAEQFARRAHGGELPDFLRPYTRYVTIVWCVFFAANAVVYAWLAVAAPTGTWALYTGFGCYVLVFALVAGEYVFHKVHFRYYEDGWTDRIWRRLLPPERSRLGRRSLAWQAARRREDPRSFGHYDAEGAA